MSFSFLLIICSAFFHACWNALLKSAKNKHAFTLHIHVAATCYMAFLMVIFFPESLKFHLSTILYALGSGFFFALYQTAVAEAYKSADVSMVYPITTSSPLFIIIWAYFLLGEKISFIGFSGIILILVGCYVMNMTRSDKNLISIGVIFALLAALFYSLGAMFDKMGVNSVDTKLYIFLMTAFMTIFLIVGAVVENKKRDKSAQHKIEWKLVLGGGLAILLSTTLYRYGLIDIQISYAASIRQVNSFFGLLMGIIFFKESYGFKRAVGCFIILLGIISIRLGM